MRTPRASSLPRPVWWAAVLLFLAAGVARAEASREDAPDELIPPLSRLEADRPRVLLRPQATPHAISIEQLRSLARDDDLREIVSRLRVEKDAAAQAMVWLLEGDEAAAGAAIEILRTYELPGEVDTFHIYLKLVELGLAYDWLHGHPAFGAEVRAAVRSRVLPLARRGIEAADDHVFHNYIWMSAGGVAVWALATAGEDAASDEVFETVRRRFNEGLYPAWRYLDGLPSEPMGYWALYVFSPGILTLLAARSAFEEDPVARARAGDARRTDGGASWLDRHFENLIHSTLPDMRYIPWGDLQGGPNGGVTHEMAGIVDACTWALDSAHGAWFGAWIAEKRGLARFHGATAIFYPLYTRRLRTASEAPPLWFRAGTEEGGHFIARSGWDDGATVVALTSTDHFGDHHHFDQGSFTIWRNGLLAVDPPVYRKVAGPQQRTDNHDTLLVGGEGQRRVRGQWFVTLDDFRKNLDGGRRLETGDLPFAIDAGDWAAAVARFEAAYSPETVRSCLRYLIFVRPGTVAIVDRLVAPEGRSLPEVGWLLHVPRAPAVREGTVVATNGRSWIRCRPAYPTGVEPTVAASDVGTHRVAFAYAGAPTVTLAHRIDVGDGDPPDSRLDLVVRPVEDALELEVGGRSFLLRTRAPLEVVAR